MQTCYCLFGTDPRLTDYDTLLKNIHDLKEGKSVEVPIYDFKSSTRTGYRFVFLSFTGLQTNNNEFKQSVLSINYVNIICNIYFNLCK